MPYKDIEDLPDSVKNHLPKHAKEIYLAAYNNAWEEYKHKADRQFESTREDTAHSVAWSAVKKKYYKRDDGKWTVID